MLTKGITIEKLKVYAVSVGLLTWGQEDKLQWWEIVFGGMLSILVIELVSKWEISWVLWSLVLFDPNYDPAQYKSATILMFFFFRLSPWNKGLDR